MRDCQSIYYRPNYASWLKIIKCLPSEAVDILLLLLLIGHQMT